MPIPTISVVADAGGLADFDALCVVAPDVANLTGLPGDVAAAAAAAAAADKAFSSGAHLLLVPGAPGSRVVVSSCGSLGGDYDDVRRISDAAFAAVKRVISAGATRVAMAFDASLAAKAQQEGFSQLLLVGILGALDATYAPAQARDARGEAEVEPVVALGVWWTAGDADVAAAATRAAGIEEGRRVARDICGGDPEYMTPDSTARYMTAAMKDLPNVTLEVESDQATLTAQYPLLAAVGRCSVERHHSCIVSVTYEPEGPIERVVYFAGKGIQYDTGGADIKAGGIMAGMSRDKGGAAAAAGFIRTVAALQPKGLKVVVHMGMVRNSVGADAYVADEVITGHSGRRVLVVNTDAEGRMVMADLLSLIRTQVEAQRAATPEAEITVHSIATLTGHAVVAMGKYPITMDVNGPARAMRVAERLQAAGAAFGDVLERSVVRREDYDFVRPRTATYDVLQCNNAPSSRTPRGHQFPAAFLYRASALDNHGSGKEGTPIAYNHLDIAGAVDDGPVGFGRETGRPVTALAAHYIGFE